MACLYGKDLRETRMTAAKGQIRMNLKRYFLALKKMIIDPQARFDILTTLGFMDGLPHDAFLKKAYRVFMGKDLNLENPQTYTEKLQCLKLYDHRPEYTQMVDKYAARQYAADRIGSEYIIPLLGVWNRVEDIDFDALPDRFVLKTTHDSGGIVICKDKNHFDISEARKKLHYFHKRNYYIRNREWPYKNVPHRIIAEPYMEDSVLGELRDYKFFTFGGVPKVLYIAQGRGRSEDTVADFFDMEFNHLPFTIDHDMAENPPEKPKQFELMKKLAAQLSQGTPQLRVDFYEADGKVYFGEMTFFHCSGLSAFHPEEWDARFGEWVELPGKHC